MFQPISKVINLNDRNILRTVVLPVAVATVALATAIIGALIIGSGGGIDGVNGFVESLSGGTSRELGSWGLLAPAWVRVRAGHRVSRQPMWVRDAAGIPGAIPGGR